MTDASCVLTTRPLVPGFYWTFEVGLMLWKNGIVFCFNYNGILSCALWLAKSELDSIAKPCQYKHFRSLKKYVKWRWDVSKVVCVCERVFSLFAVPLTYLPPPPLSSFFQTGFHVAKTVLQLLILQPPLPPPTHTHHHTWFMLFWGRNSGFHASGMISLPTESHPQSRENSLLCKALWGREEEER